MATSLLIRRATTSVAALLMSRISRIMPARARAQADFEARLAGIEDKEEIRSLLTALARLVDEAPLSGLSKLEPRLHPSFTMRVVDIGGAERRLVGAKGLVDGYSPMMASGGSRLIWSAISVDLDGDRAMASFKLAGAIESSPELGLPAGQRVLLVSANTARLLRDGGIWKLASLELVHSMAYPEMEQTAKPKATTTRRSRKRAAKS